MKQITREQWLLNAIDVLGKEKFSPLGFKFNKIRISVGFPDKKKAIGQWWAPKATDDNHASIFIHPGEGDPVEILGILVHELVHDAVGAEAGHGPKFKKLALQVGLEGKMRSTEPGKVLTTYLKSAAKKLGKFPHSALKPKFSPTKKQTSRMLKMSCEEHDYIARASLTCIMNHGPALCPTCKRPMVAEIPEE